MVVARCHARNVRSLPGVIVPASLVFPQTKPVTSLPTIIESSLDENLVTPKSYSWSATLADGCFG